MRNKFIVGFILWVLMALVQATGLIIVLPEDAWMVAIIMTAAGTVLTVVLAIEGETRRLERVEDHKNRLAAKALQQFLDEYNKRGSSGTQKINDYRESLGMPEAPEGIKFYDATGKSMTDFNPNLTPSAHYVVDDKGMHLAPGVQEVSYQPIDPATANPFLNYVEPAEDSKVVVRQVTQDGEEIPLFSDDEISMIGLDPVLVDEMHPDEEQAPEEITEICKHCYRRIRGVVHIEGMYNGKMRCDPEDSQAAYGLVAEATGKPCGMTCTGHASNKINPNK